MYRYVKQVTVLLEHMHIHIRLNAVSGFMRCCADWVIWHDLLVQVQPEATFQHRLDITLLTLRKNDGGQQRLCFFVLDGLIPRDEPGLSGG